MTTPTATSLGQMEELAFPVLSAAEANLASQLEQISTGDDMTTIDMMKYQQLLAQRSVLTTTMSSIIKDEEDTLKGVAAKFN